jgi:hypothetical protein
MKTLKLHIQSSVSYDAWNGEYFGTLVAMGETEDEYVAETMRYSDSHMREGKVELPDVEDYDMFKEILRKKYPGVTFDDDDL